MADEEVVRPIEVLLVEDDPGDVLMTQEAFSDFEIANTLNVVMNGEDAIAYMRKQGPFADAPRPDLVILDLNLPRRNGREVLRDVKGDPELRRIPIVVLTTSEAETDVLAVYDLHANAYVRKPADFDEFVGAVRAIDHFYSRVVRLPPAAGAEEPAR
jgi:CheY-like chemotaxis protein